MSWFSTAVGWWLVKEHHEAVTPLLTVAAASGIAIAALLRHFAQTKADRERRITESFSKAVEQLGSEKVEIRLGGIYGLERISKESRDDHWTVMETLTAFVRERARWREQVAADLRLSDSSGELTDKSLPTDVAAALAVIARRDKLRRKRERDSVSRLDLRGTDLRGAWLVHAHLEEANLSGAHLENTNLASARLQDADLKKAHFEGASLFEAYLDGTDLTGASGLTQEMIDDAFCNYATRLPNGLRRPPYRLWRRWGERNFWWTYNEVHRGHSHY
jgi:hypothetical protein